MARKDLSSRAQELTAGLFSGAGQMPAGADPGNAAKDTEQEKPKAGRKATGGIKKAVYSARIDADMLKEWKSYITASGMDAGETLERALAEYMNRHKLTGNEKQLFDLLKTR